MDVGKLRQLPSVDETARQLDLAEVSEPVRVFAARTVVEQYRAAILAGEAVAVEGLLSEAKELALRIASPSLRPLINLSGVILHTGLGRARLAALPAQSSYASLEIDEASGARGDRQAHVGWLLQELTGAEDALVVNNCAAAVFLALRALCAGGEVVLSRGQMVEIGGSFRMPDVVREAGCDLVEVGCTNKTRLSDYKRAMSGETRAVLRCHPSNFKVVGFTEEPAPASLAGLAHEYGCVFIDDLGSGCLVDTTQFNLPRERTLKEAVQDGADIVTASGDKLLGGPQAGLILGKRDLVARIAHHPLARAVRVDKLALEGLEQVLRLYLEGRWTEIPTWRYASRTIDEVGQMAGRLANAWGLGATIGDGLTEMGSGSLPGTGVPTRRVGLSSRSAMSLSARLRARGVIGRIEDGLVWLDPRTCEPSELEAVEAILKEEAKTQ